MGTTITLEPAEEVPGDCRVCHYDELGEEAKERLPVIVDEAGDASDVAVDRAVVDDFEACDLVKYTDYYEVSVG